MLSLILHQMGMPTNMNTRVWNHLQILLPSSHHAILTNHPCREEGPLAVICGDLNRHPKGVTRTYRKGPSASPWGAPLPGFR